VLEQIESADRLGFDCYSVIEHFFFPKFSASPDPIALFSAAAQRTKTINFRTLVHVLPYHNPMVLASRIAAADILMGGRYEFGVGRGHGWIPWRAGLQYSEMVERYDESLEILFQALESGASRSRTTVAFTRFTTRRSCRRRRAVSRSSRAARATRRTSARGRRPGGSSCRRCSRTRGCASSLTSIARPARSTGTSRTSSGSRPATSTRTATPRCARPRPGSRASSPGTRRRSSSTRSGRRTT
jgi:Luciferase-like monooxygenase